MNLLFKYLKRQVIPIFGIIILVIGVFVASELSQRRQELRKKAEVIPGEAAKFSLDISDPKIYQQGSPRQVDIIINSGGEPVAGADVNIHYDPAFFTVTNLAPAQLFGPNQQIIVQSTDSEVAGNPQLRAVRLSVGPALDPGAEKVLFTGDHGILGSFTLNLLSPDNENTPTPAPGTSTLEFDRLWSAVGVQAEDAVVREVLGEVQALTVEIVQGSEPTATPTATGQPTSTPSPTGEAPTATLSPTPTSPTSTPSPTGELSPTPTLEPWCTCDLADVDGDGNVDADDITLVQNCWGQEPTGDCLNMDLNGDGNIDVVDVQCVTGKVGCETVAPSVTPTIIPEPFQLFVHPGVINAPAFSEQIGMSAQTVSNQGDPFQGGVVYEWTISSTNVIGTLSQIHDNLAVFHPGNPGTGYINVVARLISQDPNLYVTKAISVKIYEQPTLTPTPTLEPWCSCERADFNGDYLVDQQDLDLIQECQGLAPTGKCALMDLNDNGVVDSQDVGCVVNLTQIGCVISTPTPSPTPEFHCPKDCPQEFPSRSFGNANCDQDVDSDDFDIWLVQWKVYQKGKEIDRLYRFADFDCREEDATTWGIGMADYEFWRRYAYKELPTPSYSLTGTETPPISPPQIQAIQVYDAQPQGYDWIIEQPKYEMPELENDLIHETFNLFEGQTFTGNKNPYGIEVYICDSNKGTILNNQGKPVDFFTKRNHDICIPRRDEESLYWSKQIFPNFPNIPCTESQFLTDGPYQAFDRNPDNRTQKVCTTNVGSVDEKQLPHIDVTVGFDHSANKTNIVILAGRPDPDNKECEGLPDSFITAPINLTADQLSCYLYFDDFAQISVWKDDQSKKQTRTVQYRTTDPIRFTNGIYPIPGKPVDITDLFTEGDGTYQVNLKVFDDGTQVYGAADVWLVWLSKQTVEPTLTPFTQPTVQPTLTPALYGYQCFGRTCSNSPSLCTDPDNCYDNLYSCDSACDKPDSGWTYKLQTSTPPIYPPNEAVNTCVWVSDLCHHEALYPNGCFSTYAACYQDLNGEPPNTTSGYVCQGKACSQQQCTDPNNCYQEQASCISFCANKPDSGWTCSSDTGFPGGGNLCTWVSDYCHDTRINPNCYSTYRDCEDSCSSQTLPQYWRCRRSPYEDDRSFCEVTDRSSCSQFGGPYACYESEESCIAECPTIATPTPE